MAGKSFISTILFTSEEVKAVGKFLKSTFPVVLVVVVVVVCLKLLISLEPKVAGKSFISTILFTSEEVKAVGKFLKSTFPVVLVVVVVVVCWKLLISFEPKVGGFSFISTIFWMFKLLCIISSGLTSCEVVFEKYLLSISSSVKLFDGGTWVNCLKYLFISSLSVIGNTEATFPSSFWLWFCPIIFCIWISFICTLAGFVVLALDKLVGIWKYLFKSSPSSASFTCIWELIWGICWIFKALLLVAGVWMICCWVFTTCDKVFIGAALCCEAKVVISTGPWFDNPDCLISCSYGSFDCLMDICASFWFWFSKCSWFSIWISFCWLNPWISCLGDSGLAFIFNWFWYMANSSGEYWLSKFWASFCTCWFWFSFSGVCISSCLYWTGLEAFMATS